MGATPKQPRTAQPPATLPTGMRRVDWVRIELGPEGPRCEVNGVGHRLPVRRPVTLATASALHRRGVPTVIVTPHSPRP